MDPISDPPFEEAYKTLFNKTQNSSREENNNCGDDGFHNNEFLVVEECELPTIDLSRLEASDEAVREECKCGIARASREWGFFQVVKHGISSDVLSRLRCEQEKVFKLPFDKKTKENKFLNFSAGSYRWGTPTATCIRQLSWSEAFHIPLTDILGSGGSTCTTTLRYIYTHSLTHSLYTIYIF